MKKIINIFISISIVATTIIFLSCDKNTENIESNNKTENNVSKYLPPDDCPCLPIYTKLINDKGMYCCDPGNDCLPCIIVLPERGKSSNNPFGIVEKLDALVGANSNLINNFFKESINYSALLPALDNEIEYINQLRKENCIISKKVIKSETEECLDGVYVFKNIDRNTEFAIRYTIK